MTLLIPGAGIIEVDSSVLIAQAGIVQIEADEPAEPPQPVQTYRYLHLLIR